MNSEQETPEVEYLRAVLLIDEVHLDLAREVVRAGEPSINMDFCSEDGDRAIFTVNGLDHLVRYLREPLDSAHLDFVIESSLFWDGKPRPEHSARILIRRPRSQHRLMDLLALTDVVYALTRKIPTRAIVWMPYNAISLENFDGYYDQLYTIGFIPVCIWVKFHVFLIKGKPSVMTFGLEPLGLKELEFETTFENLSIDVNIAQNVIDRALRGGLDFPEGSVLGIDIFETQGSLTVRHRPSILGNGRVACFLEFNYLTGGHPTPGVH
ncbi:hypothetical protein [Xanthobacter autotrophicus]|uniref:hypothetical protein n=1 Tax=Xanthobacter autotrophicus TaxID=280 RepID=UPI0037275E0D